MKQFVKRLTAALLLASLCAALLSGCAQDGAGMMLVTSIAGRDYPVVQAIVVILAFWVVLAGTAADIINQRIDPRLRLGGDS